MGISDNPGKNQIKLPHFLLAPARWATEVPQLLLPVACHDSWKQRMRVQNLSELGCKQAFGNMYFLTGLLGKFF